MAKHKNIYSVHPMVPMVQQWIAELQDKTGRSLNEWLKHIMKEGPTEKSERRDWLKRVHKLSTRSAMWLAERSLGKGDAEDTPETYLKQAEIYVVEMLAGKKAALKPIYAELLQLGLSVGRDVKACPCKTIVPLFSNHVFAQIKPATLKGIDFGFALKDTKATGRLIDTGGFAKKDRITHRVPITAIADIDDEVRHWLTVAYDMDT
ncbi:MAG: DUF4287 domain-containing protein [Gemmataceae bacterium]|nr:DUF4287 domain-containing protein [Gemmataceae bacterium]